MANPDDNKVGSNWQALERLVATNYEALGYKIRRNVNINGHQLDIVGTKYVAGFGLLNIAIEVKWRSQSSVGVDDVTKFKNVAFELRSAARITTAIMVTNGGYSQDAQACAHGHDWFKLLRVADLEQDLFNFSESLLKVKTEYEESTIFHDYIALDTFLNKKNKGDVVAVLEAEVAKGQPLTVLVGDFGTGKSTVLERLFYNAVCNRLVDATARYPVFLRLRSLLQYPDLWSFVSDNLRDNQYILPTRKQFYKRLADGQLVILLDGFDEIRTGASAADRALYIKKLSPLLSRGAPCVLATRPTYFQSFDEMAKIIASEAERRPAFRRVNHRSLQVDKVLARLKLTPDQVPDKDSLQNVVEVSPLSDDSILQYISKFSRELREATGSTAEEIKTFLFTVYDIKDLMKRPLLLHMIVITMIEGHINPRDNVEHVGPSMLYDFYTQICAERDLGIRTDSLSAADRLDACRAIAMRMFAKGSIELTSQEVADIVRALFLIETRQISVDSDLLLERLLTDIRVCSFLSFSGDGSLRFSHKSYFEFFVAQNIVVQRDQHYAALSKFAELPLTQEIIYFLASFARQHDNFGRIVLAGLNSPISALCRRIALSAGDMLNGAEILGGSVTDTTVADIRLERVTISECYLNNVALRNLVCHRWTLSKCNLRNCEFSAVAFSDSAVELSLNGVKLDQVQLTGSRVDLSGSEWILREGRIEVVVCALGGRASLIDVLIKGCKSVCLRPDLMLQQGSCFEVEGGKITCEAATGWYGAKTRIVLRQCELIGVWVEPFDIIVMSDPDDRTDNASIDLREARGIVFSSFVSIHWNENRAANFKRRYVDIDIIDRGELRRALRRRKAGYEETREAGRGTFDEGRRELDTKLITVARAAVEAHGLVAEMRELYIELGGNGG